MSESAVAADNGALKLERVLLTGDLAALTVEERIAYYQAICASVGLNPLSRPFDYLVLNGRTVLYAKRDATDQLRKLHGISITRLDRERQDDVYCVTAYASTKDGRTDSSLGAVAIGSLRGEALANALMKAETKSKRRVTLSICGLGVLDETEVETIPGARVAPAEVETETRQPAHDASPEVVAVPPRPMALSPLLDDPEAEYRPLSEDQLTQLFDLIKERTGSGPSEVSFALGQPLARYLVAEQLTGREFLRRWRAWKQHGTPIPGAPPAVWRQPADAAPSDEEAGIARDDGE